MEIKTIIINEATCGRVGIANSLFLRLRGLIGREFKEFDALHIAPCGDIHTLFMAYPIDVLFLNKEGKVVKIVEDLKPWVPYAGARKARSVIELPSGQAKKWGVNIGDAVSIK